MAWTIDRSAHYPKWFIQWQKHFYDSKEWLALRDQVRLDRGMRSDISGKIIHGKSIVDHTIPISPDNYLDESIVLNPKNLQLMSLKEHNAKTFNQNESISFDLETKRNVNLF